MTRLLTVIASAIIFCSCESISGSGNIITQTRHTDPLEGIKASGSIDIEVSNDPNQSVTVESDDNILPYIITRVENGILDVHFKNNISYRNVNVKVFVKAPSLSRFIVSGSGSIISQDAITGNDRIEFRVSGSGDINASVDAPSVIANVSGSGTLRLQGRTKDFNCSVGGSGDIKCQDLLSENTTAKVSGSGSARVFASVKLNAKVSGSGDIVYSGNPASPVIHKSGSGSVRPGK
jgi:hypothetical protein